MSSSPVGKHAFYYMYAVLIWAFREYADVKDHFREEHFLCEEDHCAEVEFTNAFRSELDFKAHKAQYHLKGAKR